MDTALELDHALGYSLHNGSLCFCDPSAMCEDTSASCTPIAYGCGKLVIVANLDDVHGQRLLRGHDTPVTAVDSTVMNRASQRLNATAAAVVVSGHTVSSDGVCYLNIWDPSSGELTRSIATPHKQAILAAKFSPDGMLCATTGCDGSVCVFECAGGSKVANFHDVLSGDEARSLCWGTCENSGTRDQKYSLYVPFNSGVRLFSLTFSVRTLLYEMHCTPCQMPGGGGRMGGMVRQYLCCTNINNDLLCGTNSGEVLVFNIQSAAFRTALNLCASGCTAIVAAPQTNAVFVAGGNGKLIKISGCDNNWQQHGEVTLDGRILSMALNTSPMNQHEAPGPNYYAETQLVVTTSSGKLYRVFTADMTYAVMLDAPLCGVLALSVPRRTPSAPQPANNLLVSCSQDGAVRLWNLDDYSVCCHYAVSPISDVVHSQQPQANGPVVRSNPIPPYGTGRAGPPPRIGAGATPPLQTGSNALSDGSSGNGFALPTSAVFDSRECSVLLTGWSDGRVRALRMQLPGTGTNNNSNSTNNRPTPAEVLWTVSAHKGPVITLDACDLYMATGGSTENAVRLWSNPPAMDARAGRTALVHIQDHRSPLSCVRVDNAAPQLLHTIGLDMSHKVYDLSSTVRGGPAGPTQPKCVRSHEVPQCSGFTSFTQRVDNEHEAVVGCGDGRVVFLDLDVPTKPVATLADKTRTAVCSVDIVPGCDGTMSCLAVGLGDGSITIYQLRPGRPDDIQLCTHSFCHTAPVTKLRWSPDGRQLFSSGADGELLVWNYFTA